MFINTIILMVNIIYNIFIMIACIEMKNKRQLYTECKYGGPLGRPGSSLAKAKLVRPQEFCLDYASCRLSRSILLSLRAAVCLSATKKESLLQLERKLIT